MNPAGDISCTPSGIQWRRAEDLYEIGILVVGVQWLSQFEWYAHEKLALKAGVSPEAQSWPLRALVDKKSGVTQVKHII